QVARANPATDTGQVAFLFPGQGSQSPGMLADLFVAFPRLRRHLDQLGDLAPIMFPPAAFTREETERQRAAITDTRVAQPTLGVAGLAMHELLGTLGVRPDLVGGHSYGELVALVAAGALDADQLVALSTARGAAILAAVGAGGEDPGTMAAVSAPATAVQAALNDQDGVIIANHNGPNQVVISGPTAAVDAAIGRLADRGLRATRIPVACAFHSTLVAGAAATLHAELAGRSVRTPTIPVWCNTTARPYPADPEAIRATLATQVAAPVRFADQVEAMYAAGARVFVEAGPGRVLTTLVSKILGDRPHVAVACDGAGEAGLPRLLLALAELAAAGVPLDTEALWRGRQVRTVSLRDVPRQPGWLVNGHLVRTADGNPLVGGLQPMTTIPAVPVLAPPAARDAAVLEFLRTSRELVAAQRDVLLGYLGTGGESLPPLGSIRAAASTVVPARAEAVVAPAVNSIPPAAAPAASGPLTRDQILAAALAIVGHRTGYPSDMLDPDLDLEADLSIDSIKRTEILGELAQRVGLSAANGASLDESTLEELSRLKTLNAIAGWIVARVGPAPGATVPTAPKAGAAQVGQASDASVPAAEISLVAGQTTTRQLIELESLPPLPERDLDPAQLAGRRYVIVDGGLGIGLELSELLEQRGAEVVIVDSGPGEPDHEESRAALDGAHALVHLSAVDPDQPPVLPHAFLVLRDAAERGVARLVVATGRGGRFGSDQAGDGGDGGLGVGGLVRTMRAEYPDVASQLVDVDPKERAGAIASVLLAELTGAEPPVTVGYAQGVRSTRRVRTVELEDVGGRAPTLGLDRDSVVLLTGGARGITSKVAIELARATGCHIELIGRTQAPVGDEDPATASAADAPAIRQSLIASGLRVPSQVEVATARLLATREIRATWAQLAGTAASARYHVADVRDGDAVRAVVDDIYARHGRLDGVIHGAGVLEDKRMSDKGVESFERVFRTKVDGARNLVSALRPDLGFLVLFASVAGVFGNRGQADYAAANDALDSLARTWSGRFRGRVVAVDWGPWAGAGMVSGELEREYTRRGVGLISVDDGIACVLRELAWGPRDVSQVVYLRQLAAGG
ncbi:MAG: SDR family NAD(P)-dependent oxidoreductase, partial [Actinomycetota bacterium]|nr:SDR family NAD(P)-dependent oxidoreductase [Actinomycetota bacterium]